MLIVIPSTLDGYPVTRIDYFAFENCDSITSVAIPDSVISIGDLAFSFCSGLTSITVDSANTAYSSDEYGALFDKDGTELIQYPASNASEKYVVPATVKTINEYAFASPYLENDSGDIISGGNLKELIIQNGVTEIGDLAFACCASLGYVHFSSSSGDTTFTATIYDAEGNAVSTDSQTMTSKAGFFQKIIAFFKKLFNLTKVYPNFMLLH